MSFLLCLRTDAPQRWKASEWLSLWLRGRGLGPAAAWPQQSFMLLHHVPALPLISAKSAKSDKTLKPQYTNTVTRRRWTCPAAILPPQITPTPITRAIQTALMETQAQTTSTIHQRMKRTMMKGCLKKMRE